MWVGYLVDKIESSQQLIGIPYSAVGFLAGIWVPFESFPRWLQLTLDVLPFPWISKAGREALEGGWVGALIIVAWTGSTGSRRRRPSTRPRQAPAS